MIKFTINRNGTSCYGFGLSESNIKQIKEGNPVHITLDEIGGKGEVLIFYGKTERHMMSELEEYVTPETKININRRSSNNHVYRKSHA